MIRLFIGMPPPEAATNELGRIIDEAREYGGKISWVKPQNIHVTVRFLGDTDPDRVPEIGKAMDAVVTNHDAFKTSIDRVGGFPNLKRPRVLWAGLGDDAPGMKDLARQVEDAIQQLGFDAERKKFRPHLTLGRVRRDSGLKDLLRYLESLRFPPIPVVFDRLVLFQSTLTPQGPMYKVLHQSSLVERFGG